MNLSVHAKNSIPTNIGIYVGTAHTKGLDSLCNLISIYEEP